MGNNLKALRKDRGWTQAEAAAAFGMSKSGYVKIEDGDRKLTDRHISKAVDAYLAEFDFRYSNRSARGIEDAQRARNALEGIPGKRLTYRAN